MQQQRRAPCLCGVALTLVVAFATARQFRVVGNAVEIVAPGAKVGVLDDVERDKRGNEHNGEQRHANENQQALARQIPSAKENVRDEHNGADDALRGRGGWTLGVGSGVRFKKINPPDTFERQHCHQALTKEKAANVGPVVEKRKRADEDQDKAQAANLGQLPVRVLNNLPGLEQLHEHDTEQAVERRVTARRHVVGGEDARNQVASHATDEVDERNTKRAGLGGGGRG